MLTLTDPFSNLEVRIAITLLPGDVPRAERPIVVALGIEGEPPILQTGTYAELDALLESAWSAFQVPLAPTTPTATTPSSPSVATPTESTPAQQGMLDLF
jgi:hypothetical protein